VSEKSIPLLELARAQHRSGDIENAIKTYRKILKEHPRSTQVMNALAIAYAQLGYYGDAFAQIKRAICQDDSDPRLYNTLGNLHFRLKEWKAAENAYQKAYQKSPKFISACNNLANVYTQMGQLKKAEKYYKHAIEMNEDFPDAHYNYATFLANTGKTDEAIVELEETLRAMPQHAKAYAQLGQIALGRENYKKAASYFKKSLAIRKDYSGVYFGLGQAQFKMEQLNDAVDSFLKTIEKESNHLLAHYFLATTYLASGDSENALKQYLQQSTINPTDETYYNIGVLLMNKARYQESVNYFEQAISINSKYLAAYLNLGATYLKLHQLEKAKKCYNDALAIDPTNEEIKYILSALSADKNIKPAKAPKMYLSNLFNQYASYYDEHLKHLEYHLPQLIVKCLLKNDIIGHDKQTVLDLGCGTGLCGKAIRPYAKMLIGIDIAQNMIKAAREKHIYDKLQCLDINDALSPYHDFFNLIIAGDVFTYLGDLSITFQKISKALKPQSFFIFSVEKSSQAPYTLQTSMRYAHHLSYVQMLSLQNNFAIMQNDSIILRTQEKKPVNGFLFLLQKKK
jgi:predicted TPR repeat methyltransferase